MEQEQYPWIELAALLPDGKMQRHQFVRINDQKAVCQWRRDHENTDIFASISQYARPDSASSYINPLFFDIDSADDLPAAREAALQLCGRLLDNAFIPQESLELFFSGNKGFHVIVPCEVFQAFAFPHMFAFNRKLAEIAARTVDGIDLSVYTGRRLWRLANSLHRQSRRYKIPLTYEELRDISMDGILALARKPRPDDSYALVKTCQEAIQWFRQATKGYSRRAPAGPSTSSTKSLFSNGWRMPPCIKRIEVAVVPDGIRHALYLAMSRYYRFLNMHPEEILERLRNIDARHPIHDPDSLGRIVRFASQHPGFPGCSDPILAKYCQEEQCFYTEVRSRNKSMESYIQSSQKGSS